MTRLAKLFSTTAFKLSLAFVALTALVAASLIAVISYQALRLLQEQTETALATEIEALTTTYRTIGVRGLYLAVSRRSNRPGANLYLLTTPQGQFMAGNLASVAPGVLSATGPRLITYTHEDANDPRQHEAAVFVALLPGGFHLVVGRDLEEQARLRAIVSNAAIAAAVVVLAFGLGGGSIVASRIARRIDDMSASSSAIMAGDLSQRLPLTGSGDEFDRLGGSVNLMLTRIEELMHGLKEVSDNIAHDLKTPLTRLRSRVESALRSSLTVETAREELTQVLSETESLIRTFDALLLIARAEGGEGAGGFTTLDIQEVVAGIGELYEALAEEHGLRLVIENAQKIELRGSRELLSQALANLLDNAIKFSDNQPDASLNVVTLSVVVVPDHIELVVADHGPGVPTPERERVLVRFVRLEKSRSRPGSGLGLSLVAASARLHGGTIRLDDNQPGLRAIISLPRVKAQS